MESTSLTHDDIRGISCGAKANLHRETAGGAPSRKAISTGSI